MQFDTVIKNGLIVDGARNPRWRGDIGIKDGVITRAPNGVRSSTKCKT